MSQIEGGGTVPNGFHITYDSVRGALYRHKAELYQKDKDVVKSVKLWLEDVERKGGKTLFKPEYQRGFLVAWTSAFQRK
ncbi:hypothetical protein BGZ73_001701, partial [Actinomortierella ambigua]